MIIIIVFIIVLSLIIADDNHLYQLFSLIELSEWLCSRWAKNQLTRERGSVEVEEERGGKTCPLILDIY
jgi:hypothetical protein